MKRKNIEEKIVRLEREIFYVEMKDTLDRVDRDFISETQKEINRLKDLLKSCQ